MIVAFCGQTQVSNKIKIKRDHNKLMEELENSMLDIKNLYFYICGHNEFDNIAKSECECYRRKNENTKLCFITKYLDNSILGDNKEFLNNYDEIIYPVLKIKSEKDSLIEFNKWVINQADYIIGYVNYPCCDTYRMLIYAKYIKKPFINLGYMRFDLLK